MHKVHWSLDNAYSAGSGDEVRVLQRALTEASPLRADLAPFFELLHLIQYFDGSNLVSSQGTLSEFAIVGNSLRISCLYPDKHTRTWEILPPFDILLTVWRVNDVLDGLQLNITSSAIKLYFQLGGVATWNIFQKLCSVERPGDITKAMAIFFYNILSAQPTPVGHPSFLEN